MKTITKHTQQYIAGALTRRAYWVTTRREAARLVAAGYEYAD